jgi:hypothetical protein
MFSDAAEVLARLDIFHAPSGGGEPLQHHKRIVRPSAKALRAG